MYAFSYIILRRQTAEISKLHTAELILASESSQRKMNELGLQRTNPHTSCEVNFKT